MSHPISAARIVRAPDALRYGTSSTFELYVKANRTPWDPQTIVDWSAPLEQENPLSLPAPTLPVRRSPWFWGLSQEARVTVMRDYQAWLISQFSFGEHYGLMMASRLSLEAPDDDIKVFAASQAADEARHMDVYRRLGDAIGIHWPIVAPLAAVLDEVLYASELDFVYLGLHVFTEVLGLASFAQVRQHTSCALVKEVFMRVMADEGRHVAFGRNVLRPIYAEMTDAELHVREDRVLWWCEAMNERLLALDVWEKHGYDRADATAYLSSAPVYRGYRADLFRQLAGTIRDVGLWRPAVAAWFRAIGVELAGEPGALRPAEATRPGVLAVGAEQLDRLYERPDPWGYRSDPSDRLRRGKLLGMLGDRRFRRCLDVGCGDGFITEILPADEVCAFDISPRAIEFARRRRHPHARFAIADVFDFPFGELAGEFDLIVVTGLLYEKWIGDRLGAIEDMIARWAAPRAALVSCHIQSWYMRPLRFRWIWRERYPYREWQHVIERYEIDESRP